MTIDRVTLTGADDSVKQPERLCELSAEFPFVEWGILVSSSSAGSVRFPTPGWVHNLLRVATPGMNLSLHLCGSWVRDLLMGKISFPGWLVDDRVQRYQLNFHAERTPCEPAKFAESLKVFNGRQVIFQVDGATGNAHLEAAWEHEARNCVPLFDVSGGAGIVPETWPKPQWMDNDEDYCLHGYAGGLGPQNVISEYHRIREAAGPLTRIWIDMESRLYADSGEFDLGKCRSVLEQMAPFFKV